MIQTRLFFLASVFLLVASPALAAEVSRTTANDGNLVMEDIPPIPESLSLDLLRYENVRSASMLDWDRDGDSLYIATRFAETSQVHRVDSAGGARHQLTFFSEPVSAVQRQPGGSLLSYQMDVGGSEFDQIFLFDPQTAQARLVSDGSSRNGAVRWSADGQAMAYQSTRRNGASNDIWWQQAGKPDSAKLLLEAPDGSWWGPVKFSPDNATLLVQQYISAADSRLHLLDLASGERAPLAGSSEQPNRNMGVDFDADGRGIFYVTDRGGQFARLAYRTLESGATEQIITADIPWDVSTVALSADRRRGAFVTNEEGYSRLYLLDTVSHRYRPVEGLPPGIVFGLNFSPDGRRLAMSVNTPQTPSDVFVLDLAADTLTAGDLTRWTYSEVGGLDTERFAIPELVRYPTFDQVDGESRTIPAFVYKPNGPGPHPVVISIHGGPESQFRPYFRGTYQAWIDLLGVAVIAPNVRGSAGYGRDYLALDNGYRREDSVRDIGALLDWIATREDLDASRVGVIGGSYGGYMVLASAVHYSDRLKAAVDAVGISNFVTFLENTQSYRQDLRRPEYGDERDPQMRAFLQRISPLNHAEKIQIPLLVMQGQNDPRVPVTEAEQMVAAVRGQGHKVWYMNALNEGHGYARKANRDVYRRAVVLFWRENLL